MTATPHVAHDGPGTGEACLDAQLLASYIDGRVTEAERARVEAHLAQCDDCYFVFSETFQAPKEGEVVPGPAVEPVPPAKDDRWKRILARRVAPALAAAATMAVAFQIYRSDPRPDDTALVAALNNLEAAAGPYRQFESRLSVGTIYKPQAVRVRSASAAGEASIALREAALQVQTAAEGRERGVKERRALAVMYLALGNAESAADLVPDGVQAGTDPALLNDMAAALLARGDDGDASRALQLLDRAAVLEPNRADVWFNIGLAAEAIGNTARARDAWTRYLTIDPSSDWAHEVRGHLDKLALTPRR